MRKSSPQLGQVPDKTGQVFGRMVEVSPADPTDLTVLAIGIVVAIPARINGTP